MDNIPWTIYNGQYTMGNIQWTIHHGQYTMDNTPWTVYNGQYNMFNQLCSLLPIHYYMKVFQELGR